MDVTSSVPKYIAHIKKSAAGDHYLFQSNEEHLEGVAKLAEQFASEFGMGSWGYVLGLLHDKGKERKSFQDYIRQNSGFAPEIHSSSEHSHAFVGGLLARSIYGKGSESLLCNQIISHHSGLHDYCQIEETLKQDIPSDINRCVEKIPLNRPPFSFSQLKGSKGMTPDANHLSRMLFSCLVDADYMDTEWFMDAESARKRINGITLQSLLPILETYIDNLQKRNSESEVNAVRRQVQERCVSMSDVEKGFYSLTVPTGGGKTLSSLSWALRHAVHNGMKRIIIAIPYTSIIVQTASVLKQIFGEEAVLEHHSNFNPQSLTGKDMQHKAKLATENWDYPIVVTTNVQLFESMFSNKPSDCRKLHNIANSVIILDEVQTLPTDFLQPIVDALKSYQRMFGISVLFTTASQPVLSGLIEGCNPKAAFQGIDNITAIIPTEYALHDTFRGVCLKIDNAGSC